MKATIILPLMAVSAQAATIMINPTAITYTNSPGQELTGLNLDNEGNLINGSGLSAIPTVANVSTVTHAAATFSAPGNAWATIDPGGYPSDFFASGGNPQVFEVNLGGTYTVTDFVIWGYHFGSGNANNPSAITLEFSTNGGTSYGSPLPVTLSSAFIAGASEVVNFSGRDANFVRMTVTDNFSNPSNPGAGGDRVGIAEIRFMAIPEPATALLGGLGLLALLRRRR